MLGRGYALSPPKGGPPRGRAPRDAVRARARPRQVASAVSDSAFLVGGCGVGVQNLGSGIQIQVPGFTGPDSSPPEGVISGPRNPVPREEFQNMVSQYDFPIL